MGTTVTPNLGLVKPDYNELADIDVINDNMDAIDGAFSLKTGTIQIDPTVLSSGTFRLTKQGRICNLNGNTIRLVSDLAPNTSRDIITLPAGFRPPAFAYGLGFSAGGGDFYVYALADGTLSIRNNTAATLSQSTNLYFSITYMT